MSEGNNSIYIIYLYRKSVAEGEVIVGLVNRLTKRHSKDNDKWASGKARIR